MKQKHVLTTLALCGLSATAAADDVYGTYLQGDLGVSNLRATTDFEGYKNLKGNYRDFGLTPRISVGYDFGEVRVAGDYTHYGRAEKNGQTSRAQGVGAAVFYDIELNAPVTPYIGARLSANRIKSEYKDSSDYLTHDKTRVSPGVAAGVSYRVDKNVSLDAGYRYNHLDTHLKTHEVSVGLRYTFR